MGNLFSEIDFFIGEEGDIYCNGCIFEDGRIEFCDLFYCEDFMVFYCWFYVLFSNVSVL